MKESLLYFVVLCLALASSAPTDEPSQFHTKVFDFGEGTDGIILPGPFSKDDMMYVVCENPEIEKKCKIYEESIIRNENATRACDLILKYSSWLIREVALFNAGNSKALLAVRENDKRIKLVTVNLKGCHIKEIFIDAQTENYQLLFLQINVIPHENNYDVVHRNKQLCGDFLCIATYDYEGNVVRTAASFPIKGNHFIRIQALDDAYFVAEFTKESASVYAIREKDNNFDSHTMFRAAPGTMITMSTEEKKFGYCTADDEKTVCKQYDASGKAKKFETYTTRKGNLEIFNALNLEKGVLTMAVRSYNDTSNVQMLVEHIDEHGKKGKEIKSDLNCDKKKNAAFPHFYKSLSGEYCVAFICFDPYKENGTPFTRITRCFAKTEFF